MNLGNLLSGAGSALTGGISDLFQGDNLGNALGNAGRTWSDIGNQNMLGNLIAKYTGSRLTEAEREANAFTAQREDLAFFRTMQADNTKYQRQVADLQAAGLNPMLAVSGGVSAPQFSSSSSVSPGSANLGGLLSSLIQIYLAKAQVADLKASANLKEEQASKTAAETAKAGAETRGITMQNDFFESVRGYRLEAERETPGLVRANARKIYKEIDTLDSEISRNIEQAHSEQERQNLMIQQAILARTEAENIVFMRPFVQAELSARTSAERAAAQLSAVHEAYQQGLIDSGAIEAAVRSTNADCSVKEVRAALDSWSLSLKDGTYDVDSPAGRVVSSLYQGLSALTTTIVGGLHF